MKKIKLMTIVGTRPEIIRLSETIKAADRYFDHVLVHTGQNWDHSLNQVFFDNLELRAPDHFLNGVGKDLGETIGNIIAKSYDVLEKEMPDALLVLGDTNSALSAIPAKRLKIPIFHMEAGNRCFDQNVPEEINRKIVDHISDINLSYTEHSRRYLLSEGIRKEHIFVTGSPMTEVIDKHIGKINDSKVLEELGLEKDKYILVSAHREENIDNEKNFLSLMTALNNIAEKYQMPIIYSTHPRSMDRIEKRGFKLHELIRSLKPFGFFDYNCLQKNSYCVLSDNGSVLVGGILGNDIEQAIELSRELKNHNEGFKLPADYQDKNVSIKVVKIIQSYTKIINKSIWDK
jgi:UDP-N-acetylglucosamine 2-epimerase